MAKAVVALLVAVLAPGLVSAQGMGQLSGESQLDRTAAFVGSPLTCTQPQTIQVPRSVIERAKLKVRLLNLLRESLYDDAKGIVNIAREKEIKKLASKLKKEE